MNRIQLWAIVVLAMLIVPAGSAGQATQPESHAGPATQPQVEDMHPPGPPTSVGPRIPGPSRTGEVSIPTAEETGRGEPPAVISGEELVAQILKTAGAVSPAAGNVPTTDELSGTLSGETASYRVAETRPLLPSKIEPLHAPPPGRKLLPEGHIVRDRVGFVRRDQGRFVFVFEDNTGTDQPLTLLPNQHLQSLLAQSQNGRANARFRVTGTVTQYQLSNYLLLQMVLVEQNMDRF